MQLSELPLGVIGAYSGLTTPFIGSGRDRIRGRWACAWTFILVTLFLGQRSSLAQVGPSTLPTSIEQLFPITHFSVRYDRDIDGEPPLADVEALPITLGQVGGVFYSVGPGRSTYSGTIKSLSSDSSRQFASSAIQVIKAHIFQYYKSKGFLAVKVIPDPAEIECTNDTFAVPKRDRRRSDQTDLTLVVYMGVVHEIRTIASGDRFNDAKRVDRDEHKFIRDHSPVTTQPGSTLLHKNEIDDYVLQLNRHPGRHVDLAISQADTNVPGDVVLDYLVAENKPWNVTVQASNTGTRQTQVWRERLALTDNQLTSHDDILNIDAVTTNFDFHDSQSQSISASYEAPFFKLPVANRPVRWRIFGAYDTFTASDEGNNANFIGEQLGGGGELIVNMYQQRDKFVDGFGGFQYNHIRTNLNPGNKNTDGSADVVEPYLGVRAASSTDTSDIALTFTGRFGHSFDRRSANHMQTLDQLGRTGVNVDWPLLQIELTDSLFIEPLLYPKRFTAEETTLANELQFSLRGQSSLDRRLIPQEEEAMGGLYSIRGYPESIVAGDDVFIFSAEYRLHIPRLLKVQPDPSRTPLFGHPFRYTPQEVYGRPDWDFMVRTFFDAGYSHSNRNTSQVPEVTDHGLFGTGLGVDFTFSPPRLPYFDARVDWGLALNPITDGNQTVKRYSSRFSFLFTTLF